MRAAANAAPSRIAFGTLQSGSPVKHRRTDHAAILRDPRGQAAVMKRLPRSEAMLELPLAHRSIVQYVVSLLALRGGSVMVGIHQLAHELGCAPRTVGVALRGAVDVGILQRTQSTQKRAPGQYVYGPGTVLKSILEGAFSRAERMLNGASLSPYKELTSRGSKVEARRSAPRSTALESPDEPAAPSKAPSSPPGRPRAHSTASYPSPDSAPALQGKRTLIAELREVATGGGRDPAADLPTFIMLVNRIPDDLVPSWSPVFVAVARWAAPRYQAIPYLGAFVRAQVLGAMADAGIELPAPLDRYVKPAAHRERHRCPPLREILEARAPKRSAAPPPPSVPVPPVTETAKAEGFDFIRELRRRQENPTLHELELKKELADRANSARQRAKSRRRRDST